MRIKQNLFNKAMHQSKIFFIFFIFFSAMAFSQEKETYFKGKDLKKYEGTWMGFHDKDTLILILQYKEHFDFGAANAKLFVDAIIGWHCYKRNGVTESCNITGDLLSFSNHSVMILNDIEGNQIASLYERDRKDGKVGLSISFYDNNSNVMIWKTGNPFPREYNKVIINGDTIPKYPEEYYPESKLAMLKEWKLMRIEN